MSARAQVSGIPEGRSHSKVLAKHSLPVATFAPSQWTGRPQRLRFAKQRLRFAPESAIPGGVFVSEKFKGYTRAYSKGARHGACRGPCRSARSDPFDRLAIFGLLCSEACNCVFRIW